VAAPLTNWAGNITFTAESVHRPESVEQVQEIVTRYDRVHALGTGHSFNRVTDTSGALVSTAGLPRTLEIDAERMTAWVGAGWRLGDLCVQLRKRGFALHNLPSLPHISLVGACATATHGSGRANGSLAAAVNAVELVTADGTVRTVRRGSPEFDGMVVSLGALGIVTHLGLDLVPSFDVEQYVHEDLPWEPVLEDAGNVLGAAYSVSVFTTWGETSRLWVKRRVRDALPDLAWTGARPADSPRHPIEGLPVGNCTPQLGEPGPWDERLPHFRAEFTPSAGDELQSEYLLPVAHAAQALEALLRIRAHVVPVLQVCEIRAVAADTAWLSPSHDRDSIAVHFTWLPDAEAVARAIDRVEEHLVPLGARPHWGKVFHVTPEVLRAAYPCWDRFDDLLRRLDPAGRFRNDFLDRFFPR